MNWNLVQRVGLRNLTAVRGFWQWWRRCLIAVLPRRWRSLLGWSHARLLLSESGDGLLIQCEDGGQVRQTEEVPMDLGGLALDDLLSDHFAILPRWWLLPSKVGLRRRFTLPATAQGHLLQVSKFEIGRYTPFSADDVYFDVRTVDGGGVDHLDVDLAVVPKRSLEAALEARRAMVGQLAGVDLTDRKGKPVGFNLLPAEERNRRANPLRFWNVGLAAVALLAVAASGSRVVRNREAAADALQLKVEKRAVQAKQVAAQRTRLAALLEGAAFLETARLARPAAIEVWNEVTQRLPHDTHLEKLSLEGERLTLIGSSADASALVSQMEGADLWRKPTLVGSIQSDARTGRHRFTLTAQLVGKSATHMEAISGVDGSQ